MHRVMNNDMDKCVGCSRCVRVCPIEEANVAYEDGERSLVRVDATKCILCGACLHACHHGSRSYADDTERFFDDLRKGVRISVFVAPAIRAQFEDWEKILTLLQQHGVQKFYDVSLGADICTWAHIRYIQKNNPPPIITQPCPAIVDFVLLHRNDLLPYLSPIHSPMMCTAIYMKKYMGVTDKIAAISPCIAKINEFDETGGIVSYNVTFAKLEEYIRNKGLTLPPSGRGFDNVESGIGSIYSMPGGLKENVEFMIGKGLRIDKSEGTDAVYNALRTFVKEDKANLPAIFDVLNCLEGCNLGTGCNHNKTIFQVNKAMEQARNKSLEGRDKEYFEKLYAEYDSKFKLDDFVRKYRPMPVPYINITEAQIEEILTEKLNKRDKMNKEFDCKACGSDSCYKFARKLAKNITVPSSCIKKSNIDLLEKHNVLTNWQMKNVDAINKIAEEIAHISTESQNIVEEVQDIDKLISLYEQMGKEIDKIATSVHMISLNASIEAAHAGQHGRAFAVVANSIRSLAGETQNATAKITSTTAEAKHALANIAKTVSSIGDEVTEAHTNITEIAESTNKLLAK